MPTIKQFEVISIRQVNNGYVVDIFTDGNKPLESYIATKDQVETIVHRVLFSDIKKALEIH